MPRGGYRTGAGRPAGSRNVRKGVSPGSPLYKAWVRLADVSPEIGARLPTEVGGRESPLQYMLRIIQDENVDPTRRDRMAIAAAPYCHPRVADDGVGKKETRAKRAPSRD